MMNTKEELLNVPKLTPVEFHKVYKAKGWNLTKMAERWGRSARYMRMIKANPQDAKPYWIDATYGLLSFSDTGNQDLTLDEFKQIMARKGWSLQTLSTRWGYQSKEALSNAVNHLPTHLLDALHGLPSLIEPEIEYLIAYKEEGRQEATIASVKSTTPLVLSNDECLKQIAQSLGGNVLAKNILALTERLSVKTIVINSTSNGATV